jgi:hypothetical protein
MLRDSPCGGTSKAATVAVTTRGVSLQMERNNNNVVTATVAAFDIPPQGLSRNIKYGSSFSDGKSRGAPYSYNSKDISKLPHSTYRYQ